MRASLHASVLTRWSLTAAACAFIAALGAAWPDAAAAASSRTPVVVAEVTAANAGLSSADRAEKYAAMKASPAAFFRGSSHLYWRDLGRAPQLSQYGGMVATRTFLAGDQHVDNFGAFDDDQGDVVYALNDFDQAVFGDYQLDLWRAAISIALVARENGFTASQQAAAVDTFTEAYLDAMASYASSSAETAVKITAANAYGILDEFLAAAQQQHSRAELLASWTVLVSGVRRLDTAGNSQLAPVTAAVDSDVRARMAAYRGTLSGGASFSSTYFTVKSVAQRLHAGLGSLGSRRYYVLIEGPSSSQSDDRILDFKEQAAAAAMPYVDAGAAAFTTWVCGGNEALRGVLAQKALGYRVDDLLGHVTLADGKAYSVRERSPYKDSLATSELTTTTRLGNLAEQWGSILATHHARADRDWDASLLPGSLDAAIDARTDGDHAGVRALVRSIALDYADQVALDHASFLASF